MSFLTKKIKIKWWLAILLYLLLTSLVLLLETLLIR